MSEFIEQFHDAIFRHDPGVLNQLRRLVAAAPPIGEQWRAIGKTLLKIGELHAADRAFQLLVEQTGGAPAVKLEQATMLANMGQFDRAWSIMQELPDGSPDPFRNAYLRGKLETVRGDVASARRHLLQALDVEPGSGKTWLALAMTGDIAKSSGLAERVFDAERNFEHAAPIDRAKYGYALGSVRHETGDHAGAFAAFSSGAAARREEVTYDAAEDAAGADSAVSGYDRRTIAALASRVASPTGRPIIVTGLPRSGTTLVEQILTSHSAVSDGGEVELFQVLINKTGDASAGALTAWYGSGASADDLPGLYLHLLGQRFGGDGRVVDKTLDASRHLGLAACVLPQAPLVWIRRDPLDGAWSAFRTFFEGGLDWSWDLTTIAQHFALEDRLLERWCESLGDRLLVMQYEDLVSCPDLEIPKLLAHCGLDMQPAVLAPHETRRHVTTQSAVQVRQPINAKGIGVSTPYLQYLGAFTRTYGSAAPRPA